MRTGAPWTRAGTTAAIALVLAVASAPAAQAATCQQAKLVAAGKKTAGKLGCYATAAKKAIPLATTCLDKAEVKFGEAFAKAEAKGGCPTTGDAATVEAAVDGCVGAILSALGASSLPPTPAPCLYTKIKAAGKKAQGKLKCWGKAAAKALPVDPLCLTKEETKFANAFTKAELKAGCVQTGDAATVEGAVDVCVGNVLGLLPPPTTSTSTTSTTSTTTTTTTVPCGDPEPTNLAGITGAHNAVRATASPTPVPPLDPLCWSASVASVAQAWANTCTWGHNPGRGDLGENIWAVGYTGSTPPGNPRLDAVSDWASEAAYYDYATNTCSDVCGHYTQIVWRDTVDVGCGIKSCTSGSPFPSVPNWTIVVCNYDPPGNWVGERPY